MKKLLAAVLFAFAFNALAAEPAPAAKDEKAAPAKKEEKKDAKKDTKKEEKKDEKKDAAAK